MVFVAVPGLGQGLTKNIVGVRVPPKELFHATREDDRRKNNPYQQSDQEESQEKRLLLARAGQDDDRRHGGEGTESEGSRPFTRLDKNHAAADKESQPD